MGPFVCGNRSRFEKVPVGGPCAAEKCPHDCVKSEATDEMVPRRRKKPKYRIRLFSAQPAAWDLTATKLESGHLYDEVKLRKPPGRMAYVMTLDLEPEQRRPHYVKLELASEKSGSSFQYSNRRN